MATSTTSAVLTVVVSAGQSRNPEKRELEDAIANQAATLSGVRVLRIPHLYDLAANSQTYQQLRELNGDLLVLSWLFDRATHWTLDRNGIRGQVGEVLLRDAGDDDEDAGDMGADADAGETGEERVASYQPRPERRIYCIDLKVSNNPTDFAEEIRRIADETLALQSHPTLEGKRFAQLVDQFDHPSNDTYLGGPAIAPNNGAGNGAGNGRVSGLFSDRNLVTIDESPGRRWYPVIDFSRCTNCMECIDFCLFGVYGVDAQETIVVELADNCRKGCPACSRVCPQNAIMFPQHKTPAIAGAPVDVGGLKIDLSKLFGAPESDEDAAAVAARERDEQLILAGRAAVGLLPKAKKSDAPPDELDSLIDQLDALDL